MLKSLRRREIVQWPAPKPTDPAPSTFTDLHCLKDLKSPRPGFATVIDVETPKRSAPVNGGGTRKRSYCGFKAERRRFAASVAIAGGLSLIFNGLEWIQTKQGADTLGWLTRNTGDFCSVQLLQIPIAAMLGFLGVPRASEIATSVGIAYIILGESVLPQIMPVGAVPELADVPAGIAGAVVAHFGLLLPWQRFRKAQERYFNLKSARHIQDKDA